MIDNPAVAALTGFPIAPPIEPMLAKLTEALPDGPFLYEPKWDGFRAIVFRGGPADVFIQSRDLRPLDRYFPELDEAFRAGLPERCVVDGEIVIMGEHGLEFGLLQLRLHPAESRVRKLAKEIPADFVRSTVTSGCRPPTRPPDIVSSARLLKASRSSAGLWGARRSKK